MSHERIQELMQEAETVLRQCQEDFEAGNPVDVQPMEPIAQEVCAILQKMPSEEAQEYEPSLQAMMKGLQALETLLIQRRDILNTQLQGVDTHKKAHQAYVKNPGYNDNNKKEED